MARTFNTPESHPLWMPKRTALALALHDAAWSAYIDSVIKGETDGYGNLHEHRTANMILDTMASAR